ncbi:gustatory receptor for sugar taste 43a-like [Coccinella septempunctata]|uniref:gustatory receptor for sugar taste 43a-like n=1 Tax=Coccinella septempunctata TaxID=41139 RepID=UPI001D083564|nr:gustatory receptor for sugar taste 43a-like [Coccinella septempunctata]
MDASSEFSFRIKNKNDIYVTLSDIGGVIMSVLTGIFMGPFKIEALFEIISSLDQVNKLLNEGWSTLKWDKYHSLFFICTVYTVSTFILILDLYSWSERTETNQLSITYVKNYLSFYIFYFVLISQQLAYNNLSLHVKRRVMSLNMILAEEIMRKTEKNDGDFIFWIKMESREPTERFLQKNEAMKLYSKGTNGKILVFPAALEQVEHCVRAINNFFDYPLMIILITCFIHIIITIWGILVSYYTRWLFLIMNIVWIVIQTARLLFVVEPIHSCLFEMSKTKPLVAKLITQADKGDTRSRLDVIVQKVKISNMKFTAAGIVSVTRPMICTIAGAVTTYLVILYQLHSMKRVN